MRRLYPRLLLAMLFWPLLAGAKEVLVIGVENQYYLPAYAFEKGAYTGFARDLFDAWARNRGFQVEYRALPVPRLYAAFLGGQVDFKFPDNPNWKKDARAVKSIAYSDPVAAVLDGTSVLPQHEGVSADEIKVLGTMGGFTPWAWLDRIKSGKTTLSENFNLDALVRQALAGRVDGVYASVAVINYQLDHVLNQPGALVFNPNLPYSRDNYHLSSIKRPEIVRDFNDWIRKNRDLVTALKMKHGVEKGVTGN
ncbi:MAG: transporter substrate-binding domain-containing protein [Gammaproteobacteria bacterium]|nr:transporter substrate-binding domain-containing protein [Gammaproteobacteria bacterium]